MKTDEVHISGEELKHLRQVLRLVPGNEIICFDGTGSELLVSLTQVEKHVAIGKIQSVSTPKTEPRLQVTLFQGIAKNEKMDWIVQKAVELGVSRIVPIMTEYGVVKMEGSSAKVERWQRIAREAAKQCKRTKIPEITEPAHLNDALVRYRDWDKAVLLYEGEQKKCLKECIICYNMNEVRKIALFIGSEGGISPKEYEKLVECGIESATLGPRILRTETAAIAALTIIMYEMGELNL